MRREIFSWETTCKRKYKTEINLFSTIIQKYILFYFTTQCQHWVTNLTWSILYAMQLYGLVKERQTVL